MSRAEEKQLQLFIRYLTTAAANAALYQPEHPQVLNMSMKALEQLKILLCQNSEISLKIIDSQLICNDHPVKNSLALERLVTSLKNLGISYLLIEPGICVDELITLAVTLNKRHKSDHVPLKTESIRFGRVEVRAQKCSATSENRAASSMAFTEVAAQDHAKFMQICEDAGRNKPLNVIGISEIVGSFVDTFASHSDLLLTLAPLRSCDEYVYIHSTNICLLNLAQAKLLGIEGVLLNEIGIAAMLHDIGKMFISPAILHKQGKLDQEEWNIMQQHPQLGVEYLLGTPGIPRLAIVTAYEHHIGYDGRGYPATPHNWKLNTCSYMTSISDVYDALRTRRSYKDPLSFEQIKAIMLDSAGKSLHPQLTCSFLDALEQLESSHNSN